MRKRKHRPDYSRFASCFFHLPSEGSENKNHSQPSCLSEFPLTHQSALARSRQYSSSATPDKSKKVDSQETRPTETLDSTSSYSSVHLLAASRCDHCRKSGRSPRGSHNRGFCPTKSKHQASNALAKCRFAPIRIELFLMIACLFVSNQYLPLLESAATLNLNSSGTQKPLESLTSDGIYAANQRKQKIDNITSEFCSNGSVKLLCNSGMEILSNKKSPSRRATDENEVTLLSVNTKQGSFRGILLSGRQRSNSESDGDKIVGFLGIRYASAPVKQLRFMPPTPFRYAANQLHEVHKFGPICLQRWPVDLDKLSDQHVIGEPQFGIGSDDSSSLGGSNSSSGTGNGFGGTRETEMRLKLKLLAKSMPSKSFHYLRPLFRRLIVREQSEDCLNLNIYVPLEALRKEQATKLPVLVIIHGESFDYGSGSAYDGHKLILGAQMLVVTFNYRLNIFGFLPKLLGASRGNLGLMDQIAALHWIKDNIGSFGGSASKITLMGTKKGALFVNLLMLSPLAKDLFHRAIMEDGSALNPITTNHITPHYQHSNSAQYLRILARLCDCPMGGGSGGGSSQSSRINDAIPNFPSDDVRMNAQTLDCLRYKPVDRIAQRVPLELLQLDSSTGELIIQQKWHTKMRPLLNGILLTEGLIAIKSDQQLGQIIRNLIGQEAKNLTPKSGDLFEAIYGSASASTVRSVFGPVIDGSIVPDDDVAMNMLKENSNLAHRDLLIGLTHPALFGVHTQPGGSSQNVSAPSSLSQLGPDNHLSERLLASNELQGLTNERAISLVNAFVRSFYRFHNQEIANSILNHYLSQSIAWHQQVLSKQQADFGDTIHRQSNTVPKEAEQEVVDLQRKRQEFLLNSIARVFQDSLTDVPLFKVALIHSIKQLDYLLDSFVNQLFDKWKSKQMESQPPPEEQIDSSNASSADLEPKFLLESFMSFTRQHLEDFPDSSPELNNLQAPNAAAANKLKRTYLYQFETPTTNISQSIEAAIERIMSREVIIEQENIWRYINQGLRELTSKMRTGGVSQRASLECGHYPIEYGKDMDHFDVQAALEDWFCLRRIELLLGFIVEADVNRNSYPSNAGFISSAPVSLNDLSASVESRCFPHRTIEHHSLHPFANDSLSDTSKRAEEMSSECRKDLTDITLRVLINELRVNSDTRNDQPGRWYNFNLFSQRVATLTNDPTRPTWTMHRVSDYSSDPTSLISKSSFWSNFIPTLNCNKTQPIAPSALLDGPFNNSSLVNLNLQFTCQHGSKTAQDHIESLISEAKQRLLTLKGQWYAHLSARQPTSNQNHHSLRMANMSQSNSVDESLDSLDEQQNLNISQAHLMPHNFGMSELNTDPRATHSTSLTDFRNNSKLTGFVLVFCALIVSVSLMLGVYLAVKLRRRSEKQTVILAKQEQQQEQSIEIAGQQQTVPETSNKSCSQVAFQLSANHSAEMTALDGNGLNVATPPVVHNCDEDTTALNGGGSLYLQQQQFHHDAHDALGRFSKQPSDSISAISLAQYQQADGNVPMMASFVDVGCIESMDALSYEATTQEPIVLPILSNNRREFETYNSLLETRHDWPTHTCNGQTQNYQRPKSSATTSKKRVKINDPHSIMKSHYTDRALKHDDHFDHHHPHHHNNNNKNNDGGSSSCDKPTSCHTINYVPRVQLCPIHSRSQSSQYLQTAATTGAQEYNLNGSYDYLGNNQDRWFGENAAATTTNSFAPNLDYFSSSAATTTTTTTASQEIDRATNRSSLSVQLNTRQANSYQGPPNAKRRSWLDQRNEVND